MTPDRWQQVKQILQSALERNPAERSAFVAQACAGDPLLRSEVESLISAHDQAGTAIEAIAAEAATEMLADDQTGRVIGKRIGRYEVLNLVGRGGMGEVFLAQDASLGRKVALKLLRSDVTRDQERLRRFRQEARAASALNHPNILTIHEIGQEDSLYFIATEYVQGETLRQHMSRARMTLGQVLDVAAQVASALAAAHQAGIIHRDIKPENLKDRKFLPKLVVRVRFPSPAPKFLELGHPRQPPAVKQTESATVPVARFARSLQARRLRSSLTTHGI